MSVFYFVQGERGEDMTHPNMFALREATTKPTLAEVKAQFPVEGCAAEEFHWRFRTTVGAKKGGFVWVDVVKDADLVPTQSGNVFAKLLRLSSLRCAGTRTKARHARRAGVSRAQASLSTRASSSKQGAARPADTGNSGNRGKGGAQNEESDDVYDFWESSHAGSAAGARPQPKKQQTARRSGNGGGQRAPQDDDDEEDLFGGRPSKASASNPPAAAAAKKAPKTFTGAVPEQDDNHPALRGLTGDARAKKRVELRKQAELEQQQKKVAELRAREDAAARSMEDFQRVKGDLAEKLTQWAGPKGNEKNVRALLSTLHSVLWEGARWKQVSVLVQPLEVKKAFRLSMLVVHPDKIDKNAAPEVKFIAQHCFDALRTQYTVFEQRELS